MAVTAEIAAAVGRRVGGGAVERQGTGAWCARSLGARRSGAAVRGSAGFVSCDEGTGASGASSVRL